MEPDTKVLETLVCPFSKVGCGYCQYAATVRKGSMYNCPRNSVRSCPAHKRSG